MKMLFTASFLVAAVAFAGPWIIGPWVFHNYGPNHAQSASGTHAAKRDELRLLINSRHPFLTIETTEEDRAEEVAAIREWARSRATPAD